MILDVVIRGEYENDLMIPVRLHYDPADAAIVKVTFLNGAQEVPWEVGRDLLSVGLFEPAGLSDVKVYPTGDRIALHLSSPSGQATIFFDQTAIATFLKETFALCPIGHEFDDYNWDALLQE